MSIKIVEIPSSPTVFGPGTWFSIHVLAYNSRTTDEQVNYCKMVRIICSSLPCETCRNHATEYIEKNPPEKAISNDVKSMFKWSCALHNNANVLTGKPMVDWNIMYDKYSKNAPIYSDKQNSKPKNKIQQINEEIYKKLLAKSQS